MPGRDDKVSEFRLTAAQYMILAIFLVLAYGLWKLQVMESGYYASAAEKNRIRNVPILAPRGKILDREGRIIVDNYPSFSALLLRDSSRDFNADADLIAQGLHLDANEVPVSYTHLHGEDAELLHSEGAQPEDAGASPDRDRGTVGNHAGGERCV